MRRVLRSRIECTSALAEYIEDDSIEYGVGEKEMVAKLVGWGGKVIRSNSKKAKRGVENERPLVKRMVSGAMTSADEATEIE